MKNYKKQQTRKMWNQQNHFAINQTAGSPRDLIFRVTLTLDELQKKLNTILAVSTEKIKEAMTNRRFDTARIVKQNKAVGRPDQSV